MSISTAVLLLVLVGAFLYALHLVVRSAVREGVQQALRADLLAGPPSASRLADQAPPVQQQPRRER